MVVLSGREDLSNSSKDVSKQRILMVCSLVVLSGRKDLSKSSKDLIKQFVKQLRKLKRC